MLGQLICLDRRYQRMNCFNIREVQSLLKRRFFVDLISSNDHRMLLNKTMVGLRFKTNDLSTINSHFYLSTNFGLTLSLKVRNTFITETLLINNLSTINTTSILYSRINFFNNKHSSQFIIIRFLTNLYNCWLAKHTFFVGKATILQNNFLIFSRNLIDSTQELFFSFITMGWTLISFYSRMLGLMQILFKSTLLNLSLISANMLVNFFFLSQKIISYVTLNEVLFQNAFDVYSKVGFLFSNHENFGIIKWFKYNFFMYIIDQPFWTLFKIFKLIFRFLIWRPLCVACNWLFDFIITIHENLFIVSNFIVNQIPKDLFSKFFKINNNNINIFSFKTIQNASFYGNYWSLFFNFEYQNYPFRYTLLRATTDYWSTTGNIFRTSFSFIPNLHEAIENPKLLFIAHRAWSGFLSIWYTPVLFNSDEINIDFFLRVINIFKSKNDEFRELFLLSQAGYSQYLYFIFFSLKRTATLLSCNDIKISFYEILSIFDNVIMYLVFLNAFFMHSIILCWQRFFFLLKNLYTLTFVNQFNLPAIFSNTSLYVSDLNLMDQKKYENEETFLYHRGLRFNSPIFAYDYRTGNYFPKFYQETFTHLLPTLAALTGGVRTSQWFLSETADNAFTANISTFFSSTAVFTPKLHYKVWSIESNRLLPSDAFYGLVKGLNKKKFNSTYWVSFSNLNQKFANMFLSSSTQHRVYSNWRQLKFTREAWRCKLLTARHQKSLFRRYVHENGLFWSIERNARDLLPGWAMITPFSSRTRFTAIGKVDIGVSAIILVLISSIVSSVNFLVTYRYLSTLNNRKMRDARSFFTEGIMCSAWMMIAANPMLIIGLIMLLCDRHWQTSFFDYSGGGDTILFQHMFWFFGHPEVYIVIIPTFGFVNTLFSYYLKKRISARASLLYSIYTIAFLGFFVWGHHMYMVGLSHTTRMLFSTLTVMISVPAATKLMHWCVTLVNSSFTVELPFLFMLTYVFLFVSGGISGMCVAHTGMDVLFHDTFYVIGHFHVMFAGAAMFGSFGAFYFYFPAIFGVKYSRIYAYLHFTYYLLGQLLTVIPMFWLGYAGMPRRVLDYPSAFGGWHSIITAGHMLSVAGLISFFIMIFDSLRQSKAATRTNFGIMRYNTRLNFYLYEISRITFIQQKGLHLYRYFRPTSFKLNGYHYTNYEYLETTLYSYTFTKKKKS